nr:MAG TPA: LAMBDA REPRESSOR (TRIPLE MUTANT)/DNA COMPLEX-DNA COMPLEX, DOUBLE HELIX, TRANSCRIPTION-DNA.1A [Caudoviricetes sp.]
MDYRHIDSGYALAKKAGLLPGTVNHLLYGRRATCSYRTARAIEEALGCPKGFLFAFRLSKVSDYSTQSLE